MTFSLTITMLIIAFMLASMPMATEAVCTTPYFALSWSNVLGTPYNFTTTASGPANIGALLVANGSTNLTLRSVPSFSNADPFAPTGQYGLIYVFLNSSVPLLVRTFNKNAFSSISYVPTSNIYIPGTSALTPDTPYGFNRSIPAEKATESAIIFTNGVNSNGAYLITLQLTVTAGGSGCTGTNYTVALFNPTASDVVGNLIFYGFRGQKFQIHGTDGSIYNIISDPELQLNARFVFLTGPRSCPIMPTTGLQSKSCWTHTGSYLSEIGLLVKSSSDRIQVTAGPANAGFSFIKCNSCEILSSHELRLTAGPYVIEVENIDGFINLRSVMVQVPLEDLVSHGLLGQTWRTLTSNKVIEGTVNDYAIAENDLFSTKYLFNVYSLSFL